MAEVKQLNIKISPDLYREIKVRAAMENTDIKTFMCDAVTTYMKKRTPLRKRQSVA